MATTVAKKTLSVVGQKSEFLIKHLPHVDETQSQLPNGKILKLSSKGDDWVSNQVFWREWYGYEPETVPLFFRLAEKSKVTFDIGAFVGIFALLAAHANSNSKIFAFEPLLSIYERLLINISLNNLENIETILGAVGQDEGEMEFYHQDGNDVPTSSSLSFNFMKGTKNLISTKVKVFKLDQFVREKNLEQVGLIKIDTETTEPDVLLGAKNILKKDQPDIICEVLPGRAEGGKLKEILAPLGYKFYLLAPEGAVLHEEIKGHPEFLNYLFTKKTADEIIKLYD